MGEYAYRRSDGQEIKIGTCEMMYYIRYEDRLKVRSKENNLDPATCMNLFWRLPYPDEDEIKIGEYEDYNRGLRLYKDGDDYTCEDLLQFPGTMQIKHDRSGLLVDVKCYHGIKLPQESDDFRPFWNGKSWFIELKWIKNTEKGLKPVIECRFCYKMWSCEWDEIMPWVRDEIMVTRLQGYT